MDIFGRVVHAMETRSGVSAKTGNPWAMKDYVLEIPNGQFSPRHFVFTVFGEERIKQFSLRKDEDVTIQFDIDATEYKGKWYNRITAYNVIRHTATPSSVQPTVQQQSNNVGQQQANVSAPQNVQDDADLPF